MLQKQKFFVPLDGLNTRKDDKFLLPGEVKNLENGVYRKEGRIDKKLGFANLTKNIFGGGTLSEAKGVYTLGDELLCEADGHIYSYSENSSAWIDKGQFIRTSTETQSIMRNNAEQYDYQFATIGNVRIHVWYDTRLKYSIQDIETGTYYVYDTTLTSATNQARPRVIASGTDFHIFCWSGSSGLRYLKISATTPTTLPADILFLGGLLANPGLKFDVTNIGSTFFLSYHNSSGNITTNRYDNADFTVAAATNTYTPGVAVGTDARSSMYVTTSTVSGTSYVHTAWQDTNERTHVRILDTSFNVIMADDDFTAEFYAPLITAVQESSASHTLTWFASPPANASTSTHFDQVHTGTMGTSGMITDMSFLNPRNMRLVTQAFKVDDISCVGVVLTQVDQRCIFFVDSDFNIITKIAAGEAGTAENSRRVIPVEVSGSTVTVGFNQLGQYKVEDNVGSSVEGLGLATINFGESNSCSVTKVNDALYFASGVLKVYDGVSVFDDNFAYYPDVISDDHLSGNPGNVEAGTYQYTATYEWLDNKGNLHRSAPALPYEITTAGSLTIIVDVSILSLSDKINQGRSQVKVVLWRTDETGAGPFYRVTDRDNDPDTINFVMRLTDNYSNTTITANEILYTQGGVLENIQAPASTSVTNHKNHLVITGLEDGEVLRSTKPAERHTAPGFNEALETRTSSEGGRNIAVASMDDKLVIFKESATYFCVGDGPDPFGAGMFTSPQLISDTIGCPYKNSIVLTTDGLMFQSSQGIYLLSRGLELIPMDAPDDYVDSEIVNVVKIKDQNEVRFCQASGSILVYNWDFKRWSLFPDKSCVGSTIWQDKHVIVTSAAQVSYEDSSTYLDNSVFVPMEITTGWIQLDEIAGLQRIYKVQVVGEYLTPHKLTVDISYDQDDSTVETHQLAVSADPKEYIYEFRPRRQKCSSIQFTLRDVVPTSGTGTGQALSISGLRLIVGVKSRLSNVPNTRRF
jgi:hypothetical protein